MQSLKYDLKLFLHDAVSVDLETFIPLFHRWIQDQRLQELLIDVADYRHVHHGPGVMLIAHDAHYAMDMAQGRLGLLYSRRRETHPSRQALHNVTDRLRSVFHCALTACQELETDPALQGRLRFRGDELLLRLNDRLQAPNTAAAYQALRQHLEPFLTALYPDQHVEVEHVSSPTTAGLTVVIKAAQAPDITTLLARLEACQQPITLTGTPG
jgi:hypothetical protein